MITRAYDLNLVVCTVGGVAISGYGATDAIALAPDSDRVEVTKTADGDSVYSRVGDRSHTVTVTVMQSSRAYQLLSGLYEAQHGDAIGIGPSVLLPNPFFLFDPSNGDTITAGTAVFLSQPTPAAKGRTEGEVVFRMHLAKPTIIRGALIT